MSKNDFDSLSRKIKKGIDLSYRRLLEERCRTGQPLIIRNDEGQIVEVDAKDLMVKLYGKTDRQNSDNLHTIQRQSY